MSKKKVLKETFKMNIINENKCTTYQNMCKAAKAVLRGKSVALNVSIRNEKRSQVDNQMSSRNQRRVN